MARREHREKASRRRRREAEASQERSLSARLSETHSPRDLERMDTPSPLPSSPVGQLNRIESMEAAQRMPLSPTVNIVNQGFDFSPASFEELSTESQSILDSLMPPPLPAPRTLSPAGVGVPARNVSQSPVPTIRGPVSARPTQGVNNLDGDHHHHHHLEEEEEEEEEVMIVEDRLMGATHLDRDGVGCLRIVGIYKTPSNRCQTRNETICVKRMCKQ